MFREIFSYNLTIYYNQMTSNTISNIAQQIANKTDGDAAQIKKEMERKILNAINDVSSKNYTIPDLETMLTSSQAKNQILCLKKNIAKKGGAMSGGNGDSRAALANMCAFAIIGIIALVIALSQSSAENNLENILNFAAWNYGGGRKRKTRKRKTRKKRRKNLKQKRN